MIETVSLWLREKKKIKRDLNLKTLIYMKNNDIHKMHEMDNEMTEDSHVMHIPEEQMKYIKESKKPKINKFNWK